MDPGTSDQDTAHCCSVDAQPSSFPDDKPSPMQRSQPGYFDSDAVPSLAYTLAGRTAIAAGFGVAVGPEVNRQGSTLA